MTSSPCLFARGNRPPGSAPATINVSAVTDEPAHPCHSGPIIGPAPSTVVGHRAAWRTSWHAPSPSQPGGRKGRIPDVPRLFDRARSRPEAQDRPGAHGRRLRQSRQDQHEGRGLSEAAHLSRHRRQARRRDGCKGEGAAVLHDQGRRRGLPETLLQGQGRQPARHRRRRHDRQQLGRRDDDLRQQRPAGGVRQRGQAARLCPAQAADIHHRPEREGSPCVDGRHGQPDLPTTPGTDGP